MTHQDAGSGARTGKRAAVYLRVSTDDQARDGYGLDVQRERSRAQVVAKGWTIAGEYVDAGVSGTIPAPDRPAMGALLADLDAGRVDAVVVLALDRLGRSTRVVLDLVERLTHAGAELVSCNESLDTSTPSGRFVMRMFASLAELERDNIVARTTAGRNARGRVDGERGGRVPLGYVRADSGLEVDPGGAELVKRIYSMRRRGATLQAIADAMNADGVRTRRGGSWYPSVVREVLEHRAVYVGGTRGPSPVHWPAILRPSDVRGATRDQRRRVPVA